MIINNQVNTFSLNNESNGKGRIFTSRFLEPGSAKYPDKMLYLSKEAIDNFINSFIGAPVVIQHKDITAENEKDDVVGYVTNTWYNSDDGWFYCSGIIFDKEAFNLIENHNWNVSCSYDITETIDKPGVWHDIPYDFEVVNGNFLHLAIVDNPRYERANIVLNSKDKKMGLVDFIKNKKIKNEGDKMYKKDEREWPDRRDNERVDKRELIREVGGILRSAGVDDELIRTVMKKVEEASYERSERDTADNETEEDRRRRYLDLDERRADRNEREAEKLARRDEREIPGRREVDNNHIYSEEQRVYRDYIDELDDDIDPIDNKCSRRDNSKNVTVKDILNTPIAPQTKSLYESKADRLALGKELF